MDYVRDVSKILSEMEENLERGQQQTRDGIALLKNIEHIKIPTLNIGIVTFKKVNHEHIVDYFHIIENEIVIGNFYFQGYVISDMWQVVMTVFGETMESNFTARSRVLNSFLSTLEYFDLKAKQGSIIKK